MASVWLDLASGDWLVDHLSGVFSTRGCRMVYSCFLSPLTSPWSSIIVSSSSPQVRSISGTTQT